MRSEISCVCDAAARARHHHLGEPAGVDVDELMRPDRLDDASVDTAPVVPRSGARKIGMSATGPAFSTRSPMRTTSPVTVTLARSAGRADCAAAGVTAGAANASSKTNAANDCADHGRGSFSSRQLRGCLQHFVGRGDDLGVHLVGALRGDQIGDLGHRLDVGLFEAALQQRAGAVGAGRAVLRRAGGRRGGEQVVAVRLQAGIVDESSST